MSEFLNDLFFMKWAEDVSEASTCAKIKVGSVITKNKRVVSLGYNGVPSGVDHCCNHFSGDLSREVLGEDEFLKLHSEFSNNFELHAESNAIIDALNRQQDLTGTTLYCTYSPCSHCSKLIIQTGIKRVVFKKFYSVEPVQWLSQFISVTHLPD